MTTPLNYTQIDNKYTKYISKGDSILYNQEGRSINGTAVAISPKSIKVKLDNSDICVDVKNDCVSIQKKCTPSIIPIEKNDLVSVQYEGENCTAIVLRTQVQTVTVVLVGGKITKSVAFPYTQLKFMAKGYTNWIQDEAFFANDQNTQNTGMLNQMNTRINTQTQSNVSQMSNVKQTRGMNDIGSNNISQYSNTQATDNSHLPPAVALLYPAPCVVMAVPHLTDPNSYPEAMAVHLPWSPNNPTVLPVVRMGSGTVLVVVPNTLPTQNQTVTTAQVASTNTMHQNIQQQQPMQQQQALQQQQQTVQQQQQPMQQQQPVQQQQQQPMQQQQQAIQQQQQPMQQQQQAIQQQQQTIQQQPMQQQYYNTANTPMIQTQTMNIMQGQVQNTKQIPTKTEVKLEQNTYMNPAINNVRGNMISTQQQPMMNNQPQTNNVNMQVNVNQIQNIQGNTQPFC
ncbi:hypothetical protein WA158_001238 [Blastocystis sp. Blastoise]